MSSESGSLAEHGKYPVDTVVSMSRDVPIVEPSSSELDSLGRTPDERTARAISLLYHRTVPGDGTAFVRLPTFSHL